MEPTSVIDDAEFWLPPEFLTDDDFLVEKENNGGGIDESNKKRHGFDSCFGFTCKPIGDEDHFLAGLTKQMVQSTLEDDFSTGFSGNDNKVTRHSTNFSLNFSLLTVDFRFFGVLISNSFSDGPAGVGYDSFASLCRRNRMRLPESDFNPEPPVASFFSGDMGSVLRRGGGNGEDEYQRRIVRLQQPD